MSAYLYIGGAMGGRLEPDLGKLWIKATRLVRIAGRKWKPAAFLVLVFSIIGIAWRLQTSQSIIRSDGIGYSSYLRLLVVHHTLDFEQLQNLEQLYGVLRAPRTGRLACQYPIGTAIAELPFFLVGHIVAQVWKYPIDGWSAPYQWSIFAAGMFWFCVGILASWTFVANRTSPGLASIAILTVVFGTNLFHYAVGEPSMSHVYAFGVLGLMLLLGDCFWRAPSAKWALTLGLSVGFLFSIRNYDILFAPVALYPALYPANLQKVKLFGPVFVAGAFLAMLPHFLIVTYYLGAPWANTYWMAPLNWTHSQLGLVLFSVRKGWFFWTPVVGVGVLGLASGLRTKLRWTCALGMSGIAALAYLVSIWIEPAMGCSFGHRAFVDALPIVALGIALIWVYPVTKAVVPVLIVLNLFLTWAYWKGYIFCDGTTWRTYSRVVQMPFRAVFGGGGGAKDSSKPDGLAADVKILRVRRDSDSLAVTAKLRNTGSALWLSDPGYGTVYMAVRPFDQADCQGAALWEWRERIPVEIAPSQETVLSTSIPVSWLTRPFKYVCVEMMSERVVWFRQLGSRPDAIRMLSEEERLRKFMEKADPVLYLDFEDASQGEFLDKSGNGLDAIIHGTVIAVPGGIKGRAAKFNGASWLEIEDPGVFNAPDLTISLCAKPATISGRRGLASKRISNSVAPWVVFQNGASVGFEGTEKNGPWSFNCDGPATLKELAWTHVAAVLRQGEGITLYINGQAAAENRNVAPRATQYQPLILGREPWGGDPPRQGTPGFYFGLLDELKVWTRALSAEEVMAEFEKLKP